MARRRRKDNTLSVRWSERENALLYHHDRSKSDSCMLSWYFEGAKWPQDKTLAEELDSRGYDLKTLRFSILRKEEPPPRKDE